MTCSDKTTTSTGILRNCTSRIQKEQYFSATLCFPSPTTCDISALEPVSMISKLKARIEAITITGEEGKEVSDLCFAPWVELVIWLFGYLVIWLFGYLVIWLFGYLVIWLSGYLVKKRLFLIACILAHHLRRT